MPTEKEILQLQYDKQQMQFAIDGTLIINKKLIDENTPIIALINESNYYLCPFCLEVSNKYIIESHALIKCPNCNNQMKLKTLLFIKDCSNIEFAKWVFDYRLSGFFKKINFEKWSKKLKELGMSLEFWEEYKKLKCDNQEDNNKDKEKFKDYINLIELQINSGLSKNEIIKDSYSYNFTDTEFHYCYKEAELRIKNRNMEIQIINKGVKI